MIYTHDTGAPLTKEQWDYNFQQLATRYELATGTPMSVILRQNLNRALMNREVDSNFQNLDAALRRLEYGDGPYPVLDQTFVGASFLDPRITHTRPGKSWRTVNGVIREYDVNEPVLTPEGWSLSPEGTNLAWPSEDFSGGAWVRNDLTVTLVEARSPDPNKAVVSKLIEAASAGTHGLSQPYLLAGGKKYTRSIYLKALERTKVQVTFYQSSPNAGHRCRVLLDLLSGEFTALDGSPVVTALADGWFRVDLPWTVPAGSDVIGYIYVYPCDDSGSASYAGDGTSGILAWGSILSEGDPIPYIPTTSGAVTRPADNVSIQDSSGAIFNPGEGALIWRGDIAEVGRAMQRIVSADETGIELSTGTNGSVGIYTVTAGTASSSAFTPSGFGATGAFGITWKAGEAHLWGRGTDYGSIPVDMSAVDRFYAFTNTKEKWHLYQRLTIFTRRPSDARMEAMTS